MDNRPQPNAWAFEAALALLATFFFLSTFLMFLAPLPLFYLHQGSNDRKRARTNAALAILAGSVVCFFVAGQWSLLGFIIFAGLPAMTLGEALEKRLSVEWAISIASALVISLALVVTTIWLSRGEERILPNLEAKVSTYVQALTKELLEGKKTGLSDASRKEIEKVAAEPKLVMNEALGLFVAGVILLCSLPVVTLLRWNPKNFLGRRGIRRDFIRRWSVSEWMVWPSLFCLAFTIFETPYLTWIASNLLKPLLLLYFFHGISILSFYLDLFRMRGAIRSLFYGVAIFFLAPMIVSFGFFDLWFKFRERVKPIKTPPQA
jgi:hypothetical protein